MKLPFLPAIAVTALCALALSACGDDDSGSGPSPNNAETYFGISTGRSITGEWGQYDPDSSGRSFVHRASRRQPLSVTIGSLESIGESEAHRVDIHALESESLDEQQFSLYVRATESGLFGYGIRMCGLNVPFDDPIQLAPYPLSDGATWTTSKGMALWPSRPYGDCTLEDTVLGPAASTCIRTTNFSVGQRSYSEGFIIRHPSLIAYESSMTYEVWIVPNVGIVRVCSFEDAYNEANNGAELYTFTKP